MSEQLALLQADIDSAKHGIKAAVKRAISETIANMQRWIMQYFPRDTGSLIGATEVFMQEPFSVVFKIDTGVVPYWEIVNKMRGVTWTNPDTVEGFIEEITRLGEEWFRRSLIEELSALNVELVNIRVQVS